MPRILQRLNIPSFNFNQSIYDSLVYGAATYKGWYGGIDTNPKKEDTKNMGRTNTMLKVNGYEIKINVEHESKGDDKPDFKGIASQLRRFKAASWSLYRAKSVLKELSSARTSSQLAQDSYDKVRAEMRYLRELRSNAVSDRSYIVGTILQHGRVLKQVSINLESDSRLNVARELKAKLKRIVQSLRASRKESFAINKCWKYGLTVNTVGGVHTESGVIRAMMRKIKASKIRSDKEPVTKDLHVGVEIETMINEKETLDSFYDAIIAAKLESKVCVKSDGSISADEGMTPIEVTVCDTETEIFETVKQVCAVLSQFDAAVNKSCGLHVHLDARTRDADTMGARLIAAQPFLFRLVPKSRRNNTYCVPTSPNQTIDNPGERYKAINLAAYDSHQTIEVRLHGGTTEARKINNWIRILLGIIAVDHKLIDSTVELKTVADYNEFFGFPQDLREYVLERATTFNEIVDAKSVVVPLPVQFFNNVRVDHSDDECCSDCGQDNDDCDCVTCERCDERVLSEDSNYDDENSQSYCQSCYDEIMEARVISSNGRTRR